MSNAHMLHQERANNGLMVLVKMIFICTASALTLLMLTNAFVHKPQSFEIIALADGAVSGSKKKEKLLISVHTMLRVTLLESPKCRL